MIGPTTMVRLFADPDWDDLIAEYAEESAVKGMPPINAKLERYDLLEQSGFLHCFEARTDRLIGFILVFYVELPHYSRPAAVAESFFVGRAFRMSGAGVRLLEIAESKARELGSPGMLVSAPLRGKLVDVLPRLGYHETNRTFFKALHDA